MKTIISCDKSKSIILVDDDVYIWARLIKWRTDYRFGHAQWSTSIDGKKCKVKLSRLIMGNPAGMIVDHKGHDPLNNQRYNLKITTLSGNNRNTSSRKGSSSKYLGVGWKKRERKWEAYIWHKKKICLGHFDNEIDAAKAYNKAAIQYHGEFAHPNII